MATPPILIISDTHYHNFTQYAQQDAQGINTRLWDIVRATGEAVKALRAEGGKYIIHCGDVFHVRGSISPTVLNPVMNLYKNFAHGDIETTMISGNHDLETNDADHFASTVTALAKCNVKVVNKIDYRFIGGERWVFIPWVNNLKDLRRMIHEESAKISRPDLTRQNLVIHAPLNGVIEGLPDHGLTPEDFKDFNFSNVFVGHYHNHRHFVDSAGHNIYSVGALTHQNWGDVGSRAGYVLYYPDTNTIKQVQTGAPRFLKVNIADLDNPALDLVDHYVKVVGGSFSTPTEIETIRDAVILRGAKAVLVEGLALRPAVSRTGSTTTSPTLQSILGEYVDRNYPGEPDVKLMALEILGEVYD